MRFIVLILVPLLLTGCGPRYVWVADPSLYPTREAQLSAYRKHRYRCLKEARISMFRPEERIQLAVGFSGFMAGGAAEESARQRQQPSGPKYDDALFKACMEAAGFRWVREKVQKES